jgi:glycosyltransferase involved in cell wall biosynthesis
MALGVPVVASREAAGTAWLLDGGRAGRLVPGHDPAAMAEAIVTTARDGDGARRMAADAQQRIRALCDTEQILGEYDKVYAQAMATAGAFKQK